VQVASIGVTVAERAPCSAPTGFIRGPVKHALVTATAGFASKVDSRYDSSIHKMPSVADSESRMAPPGRTLSRRAAWRCRTDRL